MVEVLIRIKIFLFVGEYVGWLFRMVDVGGDRVGDGFYEFIFFFVVGFLIVFVVFLN